MSYSFLPYIKPFTRRIFKYSALICGWLLLISYKTTNKKKFSTYQ